MKQNATIFCPVQDESDILRLKDLFEEYDHQVYNVNEC